MTRKYLGMYFILIYKFLATQTDPCVAQTSYTQQFRQIRRSGPSPEATRQRLIEWYFSLLNLHHHHHHHPGSDDCRSRCSDDCQAACEWWISESGSVPDVLLLSL